MILPQCCSQQERIVDKTQKITGAQVIHYYSFIWVKFILCYIYIRYTHFENISIALVGTSYR